MSAESPARYRAALVGCGRIGSHVADDPLAKGDVVAHAEAYARCPATHLVAIVDTDAGALARCGDRWTVKERFTDVSQMMDTTKPDIVSVASPTATHFPVMMDLLRSENLPKGILCEKPIASTLNEAEQIVRLARSKGVRLAVMHMRRYAPNMNALKAFLKKGGIGELRGVTGWLTKGTVHNGTHWFDLLRFLAGEVVMVSGLDMLREPGDDPTLDVTLGLANRMLATMRAAEVANFTICEMDIMGSQGRAQIADSSYRVDIWAAAPSPRYSGYVELVPNAVDMGDRKDLMLHAVHDMVQCLDTGRDPVCTGEDGLEALRIALAAHESAREQGHVVFLRDPPERAKPS